MIKNIGVKYGVIGAICVTAWLIGLFFFNKNLLTNPFYTYWLPLIALYPILLFLSAKADQKAWGTRDFRQSIRAPFLSFVLANLFFWLCLYGIHLAAPDLSKMELTLQLEYAQAQLSKGMGDPQQMNEIRQQVNDIQAALNGPVQQPLGPYMFSMAIWMILGFGISAAATAVARSTAGSMKL